MIICFVPDCNHIPGSRGDGCTVHRFPSSPPRRNAWIRAIRRGDRLPSKNDRICGCHFKPHYDIPTRFKRNAEDSYLFPENRRKTREPKKRLLPPGAPDIIDLNPSLNNAAGLKQEVSDSFDNAGCNDAQLKNVNAATKVSEILDLPSDIVEESEIVQPENEPFAAATASTSQSSIETDIYNCLDILYGHIETLALTAQIEGIEDFQSKVELNIWNMKKSIRTLLDRYKDGEVALDNSRKHIKMLYGEVNRVKTDYLKSVEETKTLKAQLKEVEREKHNVVYEKNAVEKHRDKLMKESDNAFKFCEYAVESKYQAEKNTALKGKLKLETDLKLCKSVVSELKMEVELLKDIIVRNSV